MGNNMPTWDTIRLPDHSQGLTWHYGSPQQSVQTSAHVNGLLIICVYLCNLLKWPPLRKLLMKFETHRKIGIISLFLKFLKVVWDFRNFLFQLNEVVTSQQRKKKEGSPHDVGQQIHCPPLADKFLCQSHCTALTS